MKRKKKYTEKTVDVGYDWGSSTVVNEVNVIDPKTGHPITSRLLKDKDGKLMGEIEMNITFYAKPTNPNI